VHSSFPIQLLRIPDYIRTMAILTMHIGLAMVIAILDERLDEDVSRRPSRSVAQHP
jgi:hypothetical protein